MAVRLFQTAFTAGELTPNLHARVDFAKYQQGAERLKNMVVKPQGGASRRPGSYYIADAIDHEQRSWLYKFVFSNEQAYVIEMAPFVMRFFRNRAPVLGDGDGTELVSNGTFATDLAGWTVTNTGTGTTVWGGGAAQMDGGASGFTQIVQGIPTVAGETYILEFDITVHPVTYAVGSTNGASDLLALTSAFPGHTKAVFVATSTTSYLLFAVNTNGVRTVDTVTTQLGQPVEVAHPYSADEIPQVRTRNSQSADVKYFFHQNHQPYKLLRLTAVEFELRPVNFTPPPTRELPQEFAASITLAALTGTNVQVDASDSVFLAGDDNKILRAGAGRASIVTVDSATQVHVNVIDDFSELGPIVAGRWTLLGSPAFDLDPNIKGPAGAIVTLTATGDSFRSTDVGKYIRIHSGLVRITGFTSATIVTGEIVVDLDTADADPAAAIAGAWFIEDPIWSEARGWPGAGCFHEQRLVAGGSPSEPLTFAGSVTGDFENFALGADDDDAYDYELVGDYNAIRWLVSQRRLMIGTLGSEAHARGATDSQITPTSVMAETETGYGSDFNPEPIRAGHAVLFVQRGGTRIRELTYAFENDAHVAPDLTILAEHLTAVGIVQIDWHTAPDSYVLAVRADGALLCCAYERPEQVVAWSRWITGEAQDLTDGFYESVTVIPNACDTGDEIWAAVRRRLQVATPETPLTPSAASGVGVTFTAGDAVFEAGHVGWTITNVAGFGKALITAFTDSAHVVATITEDFPNTEPMGAGTWEIAVERRFIEVFDFALNTDAAARYEGVAIAELSGLMHLRNELVTTIFDGTDATQVVANDGTIAVDPAATEVEAGINYKSRIRTLRPEIATPGGLSLGRFRRIADAVVRFYCCGPGWRINGLEQDLTGEETNRETGFLEPVQDRRVPNLGVDRLGRIVVEQPRPFKGTVLAIGGRIEVEDDG